MQIGKKIKKLRNLCNLTQEELANRTELTKGYISQLENDLVEPSISTLEDIVNALGTNLGDFFKDEKLEQVVFTTSDYFEKESAGYQIKWLVPNAQKNEMEPIIITLESGGQYKEEKPHQGEEFGYVLSGSIYLHIGDKKNKVRKGESFYFKPRANHYISNAGKTEARVVWVSTPPTF